jgi:hypothetical protein
VIGVVCGLREGREKMPGAVGALYLEGEGDGGGGSGGGGAASPSAQISVWGLGLGRDAV